MRGINPKYLEKLDPEMQTFALTGHGKMFLDDFIFVKGNHCFIIGTTGSGKTNVGVWLCNWLRHTETQIWLDSGKSDEILPLLCLGLPVKLIVPQYADVIIEERINGEWRPIENHPIVDHISTAGSAWYAVKRDTINIFCFRNAFWTVKARARWMTELFKTMADWTRLRTMPAIFPFTFHIDESQWVIAGSRISKDEDRVKSSEVITENALEIRSSGGRLAMYSQAFKNIPPAIRENLVCAMLLRGADVSSDESKTLAPHCTPAPWVRRPANFKKGEAKFVTEDGRASPTDRPWKIPLMPKDELNRQWLKRVRVRYIGFHEQKPEGAEAQEELMPDNLGIYSHLIVPPDADEPAPSISQLPEATGDE